MVLRLIACAAAILCLGEPAFAGDVIYNGLHCNDLCQWWMGISQESASPKKSRCSYIVAHPDQFDADLLRLCEAVAKSRQ